MDKAELRKQGKLKKAIIFDCDNTLWAGVLGEDSVVPNEEIQKEAVLLSRSGVIIGLCSKNNPADVEEVLPSQILNNDYLSVKRVNWEDKVSNLLSIAEELNVGLNSIVMVDDSDFEINFIRERLPEVLAIYPHELMTTVHQWFDLSGDFSKTVQYKQQLERKREESKFSSLEEFLSTLDIKVGIRVNDTDNIKRIAELTQKTNQFNLTTARYTEDEILDFMTHKGWVISASVSDRFGDSGLTAVIILNKNGSIEEFLMSCRIIGRNIEFTLMDYLAEFALGKGFWVLGCFYYPTLKNKQVSSFYDNFAYFVEDYGHYVYYTLRLYSYQKQGKDYICVHKS